MVKVQVISRSADSCIRERSNDSFIIRKNPDPLLHPFQKAREYTRALNAVKVDRILAKPFLGALSGHKDGVYCMSKHPTSLSHVISGSADGEIILWNVSTQKSFVHVPAHTSFVRGLTLVPHSLNFVSCSDDKSIKLWSADLENDDKTKPLNTFLGKHAFTSVDHHRDAKLFATCGSVVELWNHARSEPVQTFTWGIDTIHHIKFNQTQTNVFASCSSDRSIVLYDIRTQSPIQKTYLKYKSNALAWNPMEAYNFTVANEDHNCYSFDMRFLDRSTNILKDHVAAVLDIDYSPTGEEIVTGSYDKTVRIFKTRSGRSREIYHGKRMQRVFSVKFSMDCKYVFSGSDDCNVRIWRSVASERVGIKNAREQMSINYKEKLKEKYQNLPEIRRISRSRNVPKSISKAATLKRTMTESVKRKENNRRLHGKENIESKPARKAIILAQEE